MRARIQQGLRRFVSSASAVGLLVGLLVGVQAPTASASTTTIYAGTTSGLKISTDGGASWTTRTTSDGLGNNRVNGVTVSGSKIYVATQGGLSIASIPVGTGAGTFTNKTNAANGLASNVVTGVAVNGSTVYAATFTGLSRSVNSGDSFSTVIVGETKGVTLSGADVYAATTSGVRVSSSGDSGSFTLYNTSNGLGSNTVRAVAVSGSSVYAAAGAGSAANVDDASINSSGVAIYNTVSPHGLIAGSVITTQGFTPPACNITNQVVASVATSTLRVNDQVANTTCLTMGTVAPVGGLSVSTNLAATPAFAIKTTTQGLGSTDVRGVVVSGSNVYAATWGGVSISSNSGTSFTNYTTSNGLARNTVNGVTVSESTIYAATTLGLSISTNGGTSFTTYLPTDDVLAVAVVTSGGGSSGGGSSSSGSTGTTIVETLPAVTPTFSTPIRTIDGFRVNVTNYDSAFTWSTPTVNNGAVTAGAPSGATLPLSVTGLTSGAFATITVGTSRTGYASGTGTVIGQALSAPLTPTFSPAISTKNGFTFNVTNWDSNWAWTPKASAGTVAAGVGRGTALPLTVTGLAAGAFSTVTMETSRSGYLNGTASLTNSARLPKVIPWIWRGVAVTKQTVKNPMSSKLATAPVTRTPLNRATAFEVNGVPANSRLTAQIRVDKSWMRLGQFKTRPNGTAKLPAFTVTARGNYPLRVTAGAQGFEFMRVRAR